ncbi:MAG: archaetidylserine decarboxylase [Acidobacteria bacterium]|nr:archaetidylserine decarboxylase [Acidobacteriota bacterium]
MTDSPRTPIRYFDRYTGQLRTEDIYGERWLRWAYETSLGRLTTSLVVKRALFSRLYGRRMDHPSSRARIQPFIDQYGLDADEFETAPSDFASFNDFFSRRLRPAARPVDPDPDHVVFPADGRHLAVPTLADRTGVYVKGQPFDLTGLLGDGLLADRYRRGTMVISRLCPVDYHRFHFPAAGTPSPPTLLPGDLFSVNPIALRRNINFLIQNKRFLSTLRSETVGDILCLEIGATNVGSVRHTFASNESVSAGDEKGFFQFGGSATITLFEPGAVTLAEDLLHQSSHQIELYARMGDTMGRAQPGRAGTRPGADQSAAAGRCPTP